MRQFALLCCRLEGRRAGHDRRDEGHGARQVGRRSHPLEGGRKRSRPKPGVVIRGWLAAGARGGEVGGEARPPPRRVVRTPGLPKLQELWQSWLC